MVHSQPAQTFAVIGSVDPPDSSEAENLALLKDFLNTGLGTGVEILAQAVLPDYQGFSFLVVAQTNERNLLEEAAKSWSGVYTVAIAEANLLSFDPQMHTYSYALVGTGLFADSERLSEFRLDLQSDQVAVRLELELPGEAPCSHLWLVDAPSFAAAEAFGMDQKPATIIETVQAIPLGDFLDFKMAEEARSGGSGEALFEFALDAATIFCEGVEAFDFVQTPQLNPFYRQQDPIRGPTYQTIRPGAESPVDSTVYAWESMPGTTTWHIRSVNLNDFFGDTTVAVYSGFSFPTVVVPYSPGAKHGVNIQASRVDPRSDLYLWLNDLLHTNKYDAKWPEDCYQGGRLAAYHYIVSKIHGNTPPKMGTIKEDSTVSTIEFPGGSDFSKAEFDEVKNHLLQEIGHFNTVDTYFALNGIVDAVYGTVATVSSNDLTEATRLMAIQPARPFSVLLDEIFGAIIGAVSLIPGIGTAIAGLIGAGYETYKLTHPGMSNALINSTIAQVAEELNQYLEAMTSAAATQLQTLYGNWGKLSQFSDGVIEGRLKSIEGFATGEQVQKASLPGQVLAAAADAWLIVIYKKLFAVSHTAHNRVSKSLSIPQNPWNPEAGQYEFIWSLGCRYNDKNGTPGRLAIQCTTDAPVQVKRVLFGADSRLKINPIEFFAGFNGWPAVTFYWFTHANNPSVPFSALGIGRHN